jgi:hypothetical protein
VGRFRFALQVLDALAIDKSVPMRNDLEVEVTVGCPAGLKA